jgi:hypothetical protein
MMRIEVVIGRLIVKLTKRGCRHAFISELPQVSSNPKATVSLWTDQERTPPDSPCRSVVSIESAKISQQFVKARWNRVRSVIAIIYKFDRQLLIFHGCSPSFREGYLLKYEVPVLAGSVDQKRKLKSPLGGQPTDMLMRDVLN